MKKLYLTLITLLSVFQFTYAQWTTSGTNIYNSNTGNVGVGTTNPLTRLHITGNGSSVDAGNGYQINGDGLAVQANAGSRSTTTGAQLEFVIPANTDGTNFWGQGRIITVAGNSSNASAVGEMILGTRRSFNKLGTGSQWYYGNDIIIDGNGNVTIPILTTPSLTTGISANATNTFQEVLANNYYGISDVSYPGQFRWYTSPNNSLYKDNALYQLRGWDEGSNTENTILTATGSGSVGIGTINPQNKLDVNGTIHSKQVNVDLTGWSDYVFNKDYPLPTLTETEAYIAQNHHLAEIPSANEVAKNGLDLGEMNKLLLKKVEELTLYLIEKDKQVNAQQKQIDFLIKQVTELSKTKINK
jgi:hypothetical protein